MISCEIITLSFQNTFFVLSSSLFQKDSLEKKPSLPPQVGLFASPTFPAANDGCHMTPDAGCRDLESLRVADSWRDSSGCPVPWPSGGTTTRGASNQTWG